MLVRKRIREFAFLIRILNSLFRELGNFPEKASNVAGFQLSPSAQPALKLTNSLYFPW
jgi:hypothetical protein